MIKHSGSFMKNKIVLILLISIVLYNFIIITKDNMIVTEYHPNIDHYATIISKDIYNIYENLQNKNIKNQPYNTINKTDKEIIVGYYKENGKYLINCSLSLNNLNNFINYCKISDQVLEKNNNHGIYRLAKSLDMVKINEEIKKNFISNHILNHIIESYYFKNNNGEDILTYIEKNKEVLSKINIIKMNINKTSGTINLEYSLQGTICTSILYDRKISDFVSEKSNFRNDPLYKPSLKIETTCN